MKETNRSELRKIIMTVLYQISVYKSNKINYDIKNVIKELLEVENEFVNEIVYGVLKNKLLSQGKVLPENDMWIAAIAIANNVSVITQDKHFEEIENLSVIKM